MVPVNLIKAISVAGFDYEMSEQEVAQRVVSGALSIDQIEFWISEQGEVSIINKGLNSFNSCTSKDFKKAKCTFSTPLCSQLGHWLCVD